MDKKFLLAALLLGVVLLSGCMKIDLKEEFREGGVSNVTMKIDMSNFPQQEGMEDSDPCENMEAGESGPALQNMQCSYVDKVLTLSGTFDRSGSTALTKDGDKYRLDVKKALEEFNQTTDESSQMPEDEQGLQMLKSSGFEYNYYVKLPGAMVSQKGGEVQNDGFVKFDLLEMEDDAFVESSTAAGMLEMDTLLIFGVLVGLIVVVAVLVIVLKRH
jgi:hypothetical protein